MEMGKKEVLVEHRCYLVLQEDYSSTLHLFHIHKLPFSRLQHLLLVNTLQYRNLMNEDLLIYVHPTPVLLLLR